MWSAVSALVGLAGLLAGWLKWRASELRRNDVFAWSCQVISALETLLIVSMHAGGRLSDDAANDKLTSVLFETGILIERGRIFFRNEVIDEFGRNKEPAYRGYRASILDPIVCGTSDLRSMANRRPLRSRTNANRRRGQSEKVRLTRTEGSRTQPYGFRRHQEWGYRR